MGACRYLQQKVQFVGNASGKERDKKLVVVVVESFANADPRRKNFRFVAIPLWGVFLFFGWSEFRCSIVKKICTLRLFCAGMVKAVEFD